MKKMFLVFPFGIRVMIAGYHLHYLNHTLQRKEKMNPSGSFLNGPEKTCMGVIMQRALSLRMI